MSKESRTSSSGKTNSNSKMSYKEFVDRSIKALRKLPHKGIHVVYSNFNEAFRQYYGEDPRPIVDEMVKEGFLVSRLVKGGIIITLASDVDEKTKSENKEKSASAALAKILSQS